MDKTRREAIKVVGRLVLAPAAAGALVLLSARPSVADASRPTAGAADQVTVSADGKTLVLKIRGGPGRFVQLWKADAPQRERAVKVPGGAGRIGPGGALELRVPASSLGSGRVFVGLQTASDAALGRDVQETDGIELTMSERIDRMAGQKGPVAQTSAGLKSGVGKAGAGGIQPSGEAPGGQRLR